MTVVKNSVFEQGIRQHFGEEQLTRIRSIRVGIAGAGGLGSNCAVSLVRSGFNKLLLCDFDRVEPSNLNRQFYFADQIGILKVKALAENLRRINPALHPSLFTEKITHENVNDVFASCDVVVEAFDRADAKKMLIEALYGSGKLLVAASGLAGWGDFDRMRVRKINDLFYLVGDQETEAGRCCPPCAPRVNIAAAKEADIVLNWALSRQI